jgi:N-acetylglucosaminyldiphosphoundecaprenol N-acetyl-beta-D-mannosaminyltransferase
MGKGAKPANTPHSRVFPLAGFRSAHPLEREFAFVYPRADRLSDWRVAWHALFLRSWDAAAERLVKRTVDICLLIAALPLVLPIVLALAIAARRRGQPLLETVARVGLHGSPFEQWTFTWEAAMGRSALRRLPSLWNVLRGEMSFVGPRPLTPQEAGSPAWLAIERQQVRPGLLSLWWVRQRANMAFDAEPFVDREYLGTRSNRGDLSLIVRAFFLKAIGSAPSEGAGTVQIAGVPIANLTMSEAVEQIAARAESGDGPATVFFVNAHCVNVAAEQPPYAAVLNESWMNLADGIGMRLGARMVGQNIRENVNGTDLFPRLCEAAARDGLSVYFLGARPGVVDQVVAWAKAAYPALRVAGSRHGYFPKDQSLEVARDIRQSGAAILFVAMGVPSQEIWLAQFVQASGVSVALGVGGLFDFYSGRIPRAPLWMREVGLEWLYRFLQEPSRLFRRYFIGNLVFLYRVFRWRTAAPSREAKPWTS